MKRRLLTIICLLFCLASIADSDVAALLKQFNVQEGPLRIDTGNRLMQILLEQGFGDEVNFTQQTPADTMTMTVNYYVAEYLLAMQQTDDCIEAAMTALPLTEGNDDYTWASETLNLLTQAYFRKSNYVEALHYAEMGYNVDNSHNDYERMSSTLNSMAGIYLGARQPQQAEQYILKAIEADKKTADHYHAPAIYGIASEVYMGLGQCDKALQYARQAFEMDQQRGNTTKAAIRLSQMASTYVVMADTANAHQLLMQAIPVLEQTGVMPSLGISYNALGDVLRLQGRMDEAARYFKKANDLFVQTGDLYNRSHSLYGLSQAYSQLDPSQALEHLDHYAKLKDTVYQNDMRQMLSNYSAKFRNDELKEQNALVHRTNRTIIFGGIIVVLLMLVAVAFLIYAIRLKSKSNQFLLNLERTREQFFTNITHEFRTPLTVILGLGHLLQTSSDEQVHSSGAMIEREGSQLLRLINQLLDLSKIRANAAHPEWRTDNVVAYLSMVMETFYDFAREHGIDLVYAPRENEVVMDFVPDYIQKIVNNLISNAVKFTPRGGHINVTTRHDGQQFIMQVADNGEGIDPQQLPHIFEPFYQAETGSQNMGTGVGLSLTQQLIQSVGGTIEVASTRGKGTVFTIALPVKTSSHQALSNSESQLMADTEPADTTDSLELVDSNPTDNSDQPRILVIEDNREVAYYIGSQLKENYEIYYATNGRMGLEKAEQLMPDLIVTDLMMPEIDGLEFCRSVRASELLCHIPIIVITARSSDDDLVRGINAGADAYLTKPFKAIELKVRVGKLLEQRHLLAEKYSHALATENSNPDTQLPSGQDAKFIGRMTDTVYSLMGRGQADVDSVASALCMSASQLRRKVQALTGKTPAAYILQIRLSNAQRLLDKNPDLTMADVALRCGFSDQAHFSHAFQKAFGMSPTQWAHRAR